MDYDYSKDALLRFIDLAISKGLVPTETGRAWRVAVGKLLSDLSAAEDADVRMVDVEAMGRKVANRNPGALSPGSLNTYQKRVATVIEEFAKYTENPAGYKPRGSNGRSRSKSNGERSVKTERTAKTTDPASEPLKDSPPSATHGRMAYPFPLRSDFHAELILPRDLTVAEAKRLGAFLLALAVDYMVDDEFRGNSDHL